MTVHFDHNTAVISSLQGKDQFYFGKHRSVIQNFHIRKVTLILLCVKSADISSDQTALLINAFSDRTCSQYHVPLCAYPGSSGEQGPVLQNFVKTR